MSESDMTKPPRKQEDLWTDVSWVFSVAALVLVNADIQGWPGAKTWFGVAVAVLASAGFAYVVRSVGHRYGVSPRVARYALLGLALLTVLGALPTTFFHDGRPRDAAPSPQAIDGDGANR